MENKIQITPTIIGVVVDENDFYDIWNDILCCNKRLTGIVGIKKIHGTASLPEFEFDFEVDESWVDNAFFIDYNTVSWDCDTKEESFRTRIQKAIRDNGLLLVNPIEYPTKENTGLEYGMEYLSKVDEYEESESKVLKGKLLIIEKIN